MKLIRVNTPPDGMIYASPWQRIIAYLLDVAIISLLVPVPIWWDTSSGLRVGLVVVYLLIGFYLGVLFISRRHQSVHDLILNTVVIRI